jgi:acyl-CoA thioesterase FadM
MPFIWPSRVRFADTDASQRIHFTAMLRHFEAAEIEFLRSLGLLHNDRERLRGQFPARPRGVHVHIDGAV